MERKKVKSGRPAQKRSVRALTGMAIGFRAFLAVVLDGEEMYGSGWIALTAGMALSLPVAVGLFFLGRRYPHEEAAGALDGACGRGGVRLAGGALFLLLAYDAGAVLQMMSTAARYVAAPESNRNIIKLATAAAATVIAAMGPAGAAGAAALWKKAAAGLIMLLILVQMPYFRVGWLTPVLGPGMTVLARNSLPAAGIFGLSAAGWLLLDGVQDTAGKAALKTTVISGLLTAALAAVLAMLVPGMTEQPVGRTFRLGRLLANDRAGLTLELPYVILIFGGMLTILMFELTAGAKALSMTLPGMKQRNCAIASGAAAACISLSSLAAQEMAVCISAWYYPVLIGLSAGMAASAWRRGRTKGKWGWPEGSAEK